jgi:hypothetical protein
VGSPTPHLKCLLFTSTPYLRKLSRHSRNRQHLSHLAQRRRSLLAAVIHYHIFINTTFGHDIILSGLSE